MTRAEGDAAGTPVAATPAERSAARRCHLLTQANPGTGLDYMVAHGGRFRVQGLPGRVGLDLSYVPDRLVLAPPALEAYLEAVSAQPWSCLEEVAAAVLEDLNDQLVTRWLQVTLTARPNPGGSHNVHRVMLEDRQPAWDNPALLARLDSG